MTFILILICVYSAGLFCAGAGLGAQWSAEKPLLWAKICYWVGLTLLLAVTAAVWGCRV